MAGATFAFLMASLTFPTPAHATPTTFTSGPNLTASRMGASFTRLPDGRVAIFGGHGPNFVSLNSVDIWRPASGSFSGLTMQFTHDAGAIARLADGRYLLAGGSADLGIPSYATSEIFDPTDETFTATGNLVRFRAGAGAATLTSGKVLLAGAWWVHNDAHTYGEVYDPATGLFTATGALGTPRSHPLVVATLDGGAVVVGGMSPTGGATFGLVERFNPADGSFSPVQAELFTGETGWGTFGGPVPVDSLRLADGRFVSLATRATAGVSETILFTVDPQSGALAKLNLDPALPSSTTASFYTPPIVSTDGKEVFLFGVRTGTQPAEYLIARVAVATGKTSLPAVEGGITGYYPSNAALAALDDGRLLIAGGTTGDNFQAVANTVLASPGQDEPVVTVGKTRLVEGPALVTGRQGSRNARLADGRLIFFGGHGRNFVSLNTAEIWNPAANAFTQATMNFTHDSPCFTRLSDGRFLLAGGSSDLGIPNYATSEFYDPATGQFTTIGNMVRFRASGGAVQLANGKVLIAGAWWVHNDAHTYGELLDVGTGQFTATGPLNTPRAHPVVVALADGNALVMGGSGPTGPTIGAKVERYVTDQNVFVPVSDQLIPGEDGWATYDHSRPQADQRLPDGRYLFLASRAVENVTGYTLFTVNPANGEIAKFVTSPALPDSSVGSLFYPALSADGTKVFIAAYRAGSSPPAYFAVVVDVASGAVITPEVELPDVPGYYLDGSVHATADGRILVMGGSERPDNFSAVARTTFIVPGGAPALTLTATLVGGGMGEFAIQISWSAGGESILEAADRLDAAWQGVTAERIVENGRVKVTVAINPEVPHRFFRVRTP
jgi:hypothetical protein